ncbi:hypothetical protein PAMC26510_29440 [Caballeronia sordidicola]|uniref:Uncharacterized protein n=1 Tax=Caballeronia sordidicola TaxID=196367 RepID=A0A242MAS3_CABSO|nr:hypothetical protein PAMC26510_29440 [Caballeronia sordidicola]
MTFSIPEASNNARVLTRSPAKGPNAVTSRVIPALACSTN